MSSYDYLKSICLLGTDRKPLEVSKLSEPLNTHIDSLSGLEPSEITLHALALDHYYRFAGQSLPQTTKIPETTPIRESIQYAPENSNKLLDKILDVEKHKMRQPLLTQWIKKVVEMKRIIHPMYLVKYFNLLILCPEKIRKLAIPTFGEKGKWLIDQNNKYIILRHTEQEDVYSFGTSEERTQFLTTLLQISPEKAIQLLMSNWITESAKEKLKNLKTILPFVSINFLPFLEKLYTSEFSYSSNETSTQRQSRALIAKALLLLPDSALYQQTLKLLKPYCIEEKGGLLSKVFQTQNDFLQIPDRNDAFFNPQVMLELYGMNPKSTQMSDYSTDQMYWFSQLCASIPFHAWTSLTGSKERKLLSYFLKSEQFAVTSKGKRTSSLKASFFLLADTYHNDEFIIHLIEQEKDKTIAQNLVSKLSVSAWEKYLGKNMNLVDYSVLSSCPHQENESWSTAFSKLLIDHIYHQLKTAAYWSEYRIGYTIAQYLNSKSLDHLLWINSTKAQEIINLQNWKKHIFDPIYSTMTIRLEIEQL